MNKIQIFSYSLVILALVLFINIMAFVQVSIVYGVEPQLRFFVIPSIVGTVFGLILVLSHRYFLLSKKFERLASFDKLTGTFSRYACDLFFEREAKRCQRDLLPLSVLLIDIDDFKSVNDQYGHPKGDRVLKMVTDCLHAELRSMDTLCRWGGEEFIVILPEQDHDAALKLGQRLCHAINNHDFTLAKPLSISIGGTTVKGSDYSFNSLVSKADKALYSVKQSGKNGVKMYSGLF